MDKTNKQAKYTRDFEIKNKLIVTRGEEENDNGGIGEGQSRNMYEGHMDKAKGNRFEGGRKGWVRWEEW